MINDLYHVIAIFSCILFMIWCVTYKHQPRSISADKPKTPDPRKFGSEDASALGTNAQGIPVNRKSDCIPSRCSDNPPNVSTKKYTTYESEKVDI